MSEVDANDWLLGAGVKSAKFSQVGDLIKGTIIRQPETQQQREPGSGKPKFWDDGKPQVQVRVVLLTEERDPEDPDDVGERALFIKSGLREAVAKAIRAAGASGLEVGGKLMVRFSGEGKAERGLNAPKLYQAKYEAPSRAVAVPAANGQESAGQQPLGQTQEVDLDAIPF